MSSDISPAPDETLTSAPVTAPAGPAERPSWLPEKFASAEQMATAYGDLEKQFTADRQAHPKAPEADPLAAPATPEEARALLVSKDLNMDKFVDEYTKGGKKLSDASYTELASKGISKDFADSFITGQEAKATAAADAILSSIGGREEFSKATEWAKANFTAGELASFNKAVTKGTTDDATAAVKGLHARFKAGVPTEPKLLSGNGGTPSADSYSSNHQVSVAMRDPRYSRDSAYRADVERRVGNSNLFGIK